LSKNECSSEYHRQYHGLIFAIHNFLDQASSQQDYGIVDVFQVFPVIDIFRAMVALSRLEQVMAAGSATGGERHHTILSSKSSTRGGSPSSSVTCEDSEFRKISHYAKYAHCAYRYKFNAFSWDIFVGRTACLEEKLGIHINQVVHEKWDSETYLPAHYIVKDDDEKTIVFCVRGVANVKDYLSLHHVSKCVGGGYLKTTDRLRQATEEIVSGLIDVHPDYKLVLVGHSFGGAVAAFLGLLWKNKFPGLKVYTYGCPGILSKSVSCKNAVKDIVTSIAIERDPVCFLRRDYFADASVAISYLCKHKDLCNTIFEVTNKLQERMQDSDVTRCRQIYYNIRDNMNRGNIDEAIPGTIHYVERRGSHRSENIVNKIVEDEFFHSMSLFNLSIFDVFVHSPFNYVKICSNLTTKSKIM
jgi:Putative lipase essential for disintegration of autophagic bodies inside the vacuole